MNHMTITHLAREFGLSRSTLLYYDRMRLLPPSGRTPSGYRVYTEQDKARLARICEYRRAGLSLGVIAGLLENTGDPVRILEKRLSEIGREMLALKQQQALITDMIGTLCDKTRPEVLNKDVWEAMLRAAGMDDRAMMVWHGEFEKRSPEDHHAFLLSLGISEKEAKEIRENAAQIAKES